VPKKKFLPWKIQSCQVSRFTQKGKKAARFVVQINEVVPISTKNWIILAIHSSGKFFLTPKMLNRPKICRLESPHPPHHFSNGPSLISPACLMREIQKTKAYLIISHRHNYGQYLTTSSRTHSNNHFASFYSAILNIYMDHLHYRLNFDLDKNFITAWKSITKLVIFQSFVSKCCKMRII
jgi:hypothetical protein